MAKTKNLIMSSSLNDIMAKDSKFMNLWKELPKDKKEYVRATITAEAAEFINKTAYEDFGMHNASVGMAISKLVMIAKDCLEKKESE
jgi:hypothetical protein